MLSLPMALSLGVLASACVSETEYEDSLAIGASSSADDEDELTSESGEPAMDYDEAESLEAPADPVASQSCTQNNDCRTSCLCLAGTCQPNPGVGPQPPAGYCDEPPVRTCSAQSDCRPGCICGLGECRAGGVGSAPDCHLAPTDEYEYDDVWSHHSNYFEPQQHNFISASDRDWTAVYISSPGLVRFQTRQLSHGTDTELKVYAYDGISRGALLGSNNDVGGPWFWPDSRSSRVDLNVGAGSAFLIEVINRSSPSIYTTSPELPRYTLELSYL
ncbi:MAG: hypothetical protein AAF799_23980 [Myxococcota bacterium]